MKATIRTLALASVLGLGGLTAAQAADTAPAPQLGIDCPGPGMMGKGPGPGGMKGRRFDADRELTADQVRVLTQAHLIRMGDDAELKVGEVRESTAKTFTVQLLNADGSVARTIELAKNGMPLRGGPRGPQQ